MTHFAYADTPHAVRDDVVAAHRATWEQVAHAGSWWTGAQRVAIAEQARAARAQRTGPPWLRTNMPETDALPEAAVEAARTIAADAQKIDRAWVQKMAAALGDAAYIEVATVVNSVCAIDYFADALGVPFEPLPSPEPGEPNRERPEGVGEAGAHVPMLVEWVGPNVARAMSLSPAGNMMFMRNVMAMYMGQGGFGDLVWDAPLSRPQSELIAARVSSLNECFY